MSAKIILVFCAQALLAQISYAQFAKEEIGLTRGLPCGPGVPAFGPGPIGYGAPYAPGLAPSSGGGFLVTSYSPIAPTGISVFSENAIEGTLSIAGELPFLGAVAVEGALPTAGAGGINYGCGNGAVGIVSEGIAPPVAPGYPAGFGPTGYGAMNPGLPYAPANLGYGVRSSFGPI